jgi:chromosome segregation ATPase
MLLLNIFQHSDGSFAWENVFIILLALIAGYLLQRFNAKKISNNKYAASIAEWENKYKRLENEFKNYKSNISSADKQNEKSVLQLSGRVKSLEGDIRALSDEKNKSLQQLIVKEEEIKRYSKIVSDFEDNMKTIREDKLRAEAEWSDKLKTAKEELSRASIWEQRVKSAEEDAQKARSAIGNAERKKLEAELRLKTATEYAGKVVPLENELKLLRGKFEGQEADLNAKIIELGEKLKANEAENASLKNELSEKSKLATEATEKLSSSADNLSQLKTVMAQLELQKETNKTLQQEFEMKHASNISLIGEIEYLKNEMKKIAEENLALKSKTPAQESLS